MSQYNISLNGNIGLINIANKLSDNQSPSNLIATSGNTWFLITENNIKRLFVFNSLLDNFIEKSFVVVYSSHILDSNNNPVTTESTTYKSQNPMEYDFFYTIDNVNGQYGDDIRKRVINGFMNTRYGSYCFNQLSGGTFYQPVLFTLESTPAGTGTTGGTGFTGTITVTVTDGDNSPEYSLDDINWQSSNIFTDLSPNTYTVYVRNADGVKNSKTINVVE